MTGTLTQLLYTATFFWLSKRHRAGLTAIHLLLLVALLEVAINRIAVPMLRPTGGAPPWWHTYLDYAGLFLFYFAGTLAVLVLAARCWHAVGSGGTVRARVAFGVVATLDDIPGDGQMRASGALVPTDDPRFGASHTVSSPLQVGDADKAPATFAPEIGEHTVEILRAAGIADAEIERLLRTGVIAQAGR